MKLLMTEAQFRHLCEELSREELDQKANEADINPSDAQKEAGNYKMGHIRVKGFDITIENPKGSRRYYGNKGKYNVMQNHYGYFTKTKGKDGDQVDVFIGPDTDSFTKVYVVDQKVKGSFDESKVMLGFSSKKAAKEAYFSNFDKNWHGFMHITGVSLETFKKWLYRGRKQRQPFADYVEIKRKKLDENLWKEYEALGDAAKWQPVRKGSKMNYENGNGEYLSDEWFNWCGWMIDGVGVVRDEKHKYNYINENGEFLLDEWYDDCEEFHNGKGRVLKDIVENGALITLYTYVDEIVNFFQEWQLSN